MRCGATTAGDGWCPTCLTASAPDAESVRRHTAAAVPLTTQVGHRAGRSQITFGPVGRTLWTLAILVVPAPFLWISDGFAGWGLAALWWGVLTPWSLRDLWRSGRRTKRL